MMAYILFPFLSSLAFCNSLFTMMIVLFKLLQVNCDRPYWFDVTVVANGTIFLAIGSEFKVACLDNTIFVTISGDSAKLTGTLYDVSVSNHVTKAVLSEWTFRTAQQSCPQAVFPPNFTSFAVSFVVIFCFPFTH